MSPESVNCPSCGATPSAGAVFCTRCGSQIRAPDATARAAPEGESGAGASAGDTVLERPGAAGPQALGQPGAAPEQTPLPPAPHAVAPPTGAPSSAGPPSGAQARAPWPPAQAPPDRDPAAGPAAAHDWIVPPPPASAGSGGSAARRRFPRWALIAVALAAVAVVAALAVIVIAGGGEGSGDAGDSPAGAVSGGSESASPATTPSMSPTATPSPQPSPAASPPTQAEQLTRFLQEVRPILAKWTALDKKLSRALWEEAHQTRDATWIPAGRKIERLTDGFNSITSALWRVDTPAFMQPAVRDLLKCARLEHRAYDKAAAMLISGDWKNKTWRTMSGAANKAWRAYLAKRDREKERLGLADG